MATIAKLAEVKATVAIIILASFFGVGDAFACHQYLFSAFLHFCKAIIVELSIMDRVVLLVLYSWGNRYLPTYNMAIGSLLRMSSLVIQNHLLVCSRLSHLH